MDERQATQTLAAILTGEPTNGLDPQQWPPGELRLVAQRLIQGVLPADLLPDLSLALQAAIWAQAPDGDDTPKGSTWADLATALGPITWAWPNRLINGMLTMIVAEQGAGKSCLALAIARCYLLGEPWPDRTVNRMTPTGVLWCEAESSQGMNLDRAQKWGLPLDRIICPLLDPLDDILLQDPDHMAAIARHAERDDVGLIIVDSLSGANLGRENDAQMMHVVKRLSDLAKDRRKPVILSHHLRKKGLLDTGDGITLDRIRGSGAITQPARVVWAVDTPDPTYPERRRLSVIKNNPVGLPRSGPPLGFTISDGGVEFTEHAPEPPVQESKQDRAGDLLQALLSKGPRRSTDLQAELEDAGLSWSAAKRAKDHCGIVATRQKDRVTGKAHWTWGLPARGGE
jgi:hypothetical protein